MRARRLMTAALLVGLAAAPAPSLAQGRGGGSDSSRSTGPAGPPVGSPASGWALLAYDAGSGELGLVAATNRFSAGSGVPFLDRGVGAVAVLGRLDAARGQAVLGALRRGGPAGGAIAVGDAARDSGSAAASQVGALTPSCSVAADTPPGLVPWSGSATGGSGSSCWLVMGAGLSDSTLLGRLAAVYDRTSGDLLDRFLAVLAAAGRSEEEAPRSRSGLLWIVAPPGSRAPLGRGELRLQIDDVQRPADALREVADAGRADALAARAESSVDSGDYEAGLQLAQQALEIEPATSLAWLARGRALLFLGRGDEAEEAFQRMLEVDPWMLHLLGDPAAGTVRRGVIPYRPRLLQRLDVYRRAFWPDVTFPSDSARGG
jgi:uncharacterized Ntn-hydrolase superfamily protein